MKRKRRVGRPLIRTTVVALAWSRPGALVTQGQSREAAHASTGAADDTLVKLQTLGELWLSGVITKVEFEGQKAKILGSRD